MVDQGPSARLLAVYTTWPVGFDVGFDVSFDVGFGFVSKLYVNIKDISMF